MNQHTAHAGWTVFALPLNIVRYMPMLSLQHCHLAALGKPSFYLFLHNSEFSYFLLYTRLGEASKRLQRERRDKLHDWEERLSSFDSFLRKAERETERLEPIGDDLMTVKQQNEDFEVRIF